MRIVVIILKFARKRNEKIGELKSSYFDDKYNDVAKSKI